VLGRNQIFLAQACRAAYLSFRDETKSQTQEDSVFLNHVTTAQAKGASLLLELPQTLPDEKGLSKYKCLLRPQQASQRSTK
jgi:hypothetical protein